MTGKFTMADRLKWHYNVAVLKGEPLTDIDRQRLDDLEWLIRRPAHPTEGGGSDQT